MKCRRRRSFAGDNTFLRSVVFPPVRASLTSSKKHLRWAATGSCLRATFAISRPARAHARKYLPEYERIVNYSSPAASSINSDLVCSSVFWKVADLGDFLIFAFDNGCDRIAPETLEMFRKVLKADKPVIVMCHVPFYSPTLQEPTEKYWGRDILLGGTAIRSDDTTRSFIELLTTKESPVCAVVAGHIHFNHEDMLGDNVFQFTTVEGHRGNYGIIEITGY